MTFAVSRGEREAAFGTEVVTVIPPERLNSVVVNPESQRFLAEVGLPSDDEFLYSPTGCLGSGLPNARDFDPEFDDLEELPEAADHWVGLGYCLYHRVFLDGSTGIVWLVTEKEGEVVVLNSRLDLFAGSLCPVRREWDALQQLSYGPLMKKVTKLAKTVEAATRRPAPCPRRPGAIGSCSI